MAHGFKFIFIKYCSGLHFLYISSERDRETETHDETVYQTFPHSYYCKLMYAKMSH